MRRRAGVLVVAMLVLASAGELALADPSLRPVRQLVDEVRFEDAARALDEIFEAGELAPDQVAEAYRLGAEIQAALGNGDDVAEWFARWLSVEPRARLPSGTSPKLRDPFTVARQRLDGTGGMRLVVRASRSGDTLQFRGRIVDDPLELIQRVVIEYRIDGGDRGEVVGRPGELLRIDAPRDRAVEYVTFAVDDPGNRLLARGSWSRPSRIGADEVAPRGAADLADFETEVDAEASASGGGRAWYGTWYPYAGLTVVSGALAGYFALEVRNTQRELDAIIDDSEDYQYSEARELEKRGERYSLGVNIAAGVSAVSAVAAIIMAARGERERVTLTPTRGGAQVSVGWTF